LVNWTEYNGDKFQAFCNDLLSFEVGGGYIPFIAPGRDNGIDGMFEGEYSGKKGKWRFQAKFHHPETGRVSGFNQLKGEIKKDLIKNVKDETDVIFITNVELNPKQRKELKLLADNIKRENDLSVEFDVWDGAKIATLLSHHPIIKLWYSEQSNYLIQEYSEYFRQELDSTKDSSYVLSNTFYHRKEKLESINEFINDSHKKVAIISGEPGIGKTRICIEFFKRYIDKRNDWIALVVATHKMDLSTLQIALSGEKNYVVLLDDADKFGEKDIADLLTLVKSIRHNKVKLLMTVRKPFLIQVENELTAIDKTEIVERIPLDQFTKEETVEFLKGELKGLRFEEYLSYFVKLTHGVPIMIMTLLRIIKEGALLSDITKDSFLKEYIKQYFNQFISKTSEENEIARRVIEKIIKLIVLIEPINVEDNFLIQQIALTEKIIEEDVRIVLQKMQEQNIVFGRFIHEIKPDSYSDLLLEEAIDNRNWLTEKIAQYGNFISNIVKNITYVYDDNRDYRFLENLLGKYVDQIDSCSNDQVLISILDTIYSITYTLPLIAISAIEKTLSIYSNEHHPLHIEFKKSLTRKNYSMDGLINNLKLILNGLSETQDFYEESFEFSGILFNILKDDGVVSNIGGFRKKDQFVEFNCHYQNRLLSVCKHELKKSKSEYKIFSINALKTILKLEYTETQPHIFQNHTIQIYSFYIPENKQVKQLRTETIDLLIDFFNNESSKELKEMALKIIIDVPREIFAARNENYKGREEIKMILDFLSTISLQNVLELRVKHFIKDQLYWYKKWGIELMFHKQIDLINRDLSENDLAEVLLELLNPKLDERASYQTESQKLIDENSGKNLGNALVKVVQQSEYVPPYLYDFLSKISESKLKTIALIDYLWVDNKSFVINYCSILLRELRFSKNDETFYWKYVGKLQMEKSIASINCLLDVYNSLKIHNEKLKLNEENILKTDDVNLIIELFQNSNPESYYYLSWAIPSLFYYDKSIAMDVLKTFTKNCNERQLDSLFLAFDPIEEIYYPEIKHILFNFTIHFNMPYSIERFLNKVIIKDGFEEVLKYIEKRLLFKRKYVKTNKSLLGYDFIPRHKGNVITAKLSDEQKSKVFIQALNWFVNFKFEVYEQFYAKSVIELFSISEHITDDIKLEYIDFIQKNGSSYPKLLNIVQSLSEFKVKNEAFIHLIIFLLEVGFKNIKDKKKFQEFTTQCYISLTSLGVKTGTPGQAYPQDLRLEELLQDTLRSPKVNNSMLKDFFQRVLKSVQSDIDRSRMEETGGGW